MYSIIILASSQNCTVGSQYVEYEQGPNSRGWYLNLQLPATCSGHVVKYDAYPFYTFTGNKNQDHSLHIAMWSPTAPTSYQQVQYTHIVFNFLNVCLDY